MFNCCQNCDARLWSDYSKNIGVCPECKTPDREEKELEDVLELWLNFRRINHGNT